jgi:hypothetical protein
MPFPVQRTVNGSVGIPVQVWINSRFSLAGDREFRYINSARTGRRERLRVCLLASGSKGNAVYVESGESRVLIDAGLSARELERRLATIRPGRR